LVCTDLGVPISSVYAPPLTKRSDENDCVDNGSIGTYDENGVFMKGEVAMSILDEAKTLAETMVRDRRFFHVNAEVHNELPKTTAYVMARLKEMGYEPKEICRSGVVAVAGEAGWRFHPKPKTCTHAVTTCTPPCFWAPHS
jgi:hypothetical protein